MYLYPSIYTSMKYTYIIILAQHIPSYQEGSMIRDCFVKDNLSNEDYFITKYSS